jgi:iron complex transport system substrate-binding protein
MRLRSLTWLLLLVLLAVTAVACSDDEEETGGPSSAPEATLSGTFPVTITDDDGDEVTLTEAPDRIVALQPSFVEVLFAIGAGDGVVAADENTDYPPEAADLPKLSGFDPSVEAIVSEEPDIVLISYDPGGLKDALGSNGIAVLMLASPGDLEGVYTQINILGRVSGHAAEAQQLVSGMREDIAIIVAGIPEGTTAPRVYHEVDNTLYSVGPGSFLHDLYVALQADNIAAETGDAYPQLSNEAVIAADPEVIILADEEFGESAETVAARPGWGEISAVKSGRVHGVDPDIMSRPGPRLVEALEMLVEYLYPEA